MPRVRPEIELSAILILAALCCCMPALGAGTTQVHVVKYANDNATVINETNVTFQWMEANLPVYGDGVTHYYHQGPVMNDSISDKWNPEENDTAILTKDYGAVKGTDLKDLCELVGGMQDDDYNVTLKASDGFKKAFAYVDVYSPPARAGPIVLTWYTADEGYVDGSYSTGIRNVMFADTSTNPWGYHVFGLWDMHETYPEQFWYYYQPGQPSTTGLSVQNIDRVLIYTNDPVPPIAPTAAFSANVTSGQAPLTVLFTDSSTGTPTSFAWDFNNDGVIDSSDQDPVWTYSGAGIYTVNLTASNAIGSDSEIKSDYISVTNYTAPLDAEITADTIPSTMVEGHSYNVSVTVRNTGTMTWSDADEFRLGGVNDFSGDAAKFAYPRVNISSGATVVSGASYTFNFTMTAPSNGTYNPAYRMVWDYHQWFGPTLSHPVTVTVAPTANELFNGTLTLTPGTNFTKVAYNSGASYIINRTTPLGALDAAAATAGFTYDVTDKRWSSDQVLLLDNVSTYTKATGRWYAYVNGVYKDGYLNHPDGLNVFELANNDQVDFFFSTGTNLTAPTDATAAVKIKVSITSSSTVDILFDGTVTLTPGTNFTKIAYNSGTSYIINRTTPLGALDSAAATAGFTYDVTDKRWSSDQVLLLDNVSTYTKATGKWYAYVNGVYKDGYMNHPDGLNVFELANNDQVNFFFAANSTDLTAPANATAAVKITVNTGGGTPGDWSIALHGARTQTVTKTYFEQGLACPSSGHMVNWTDSDGAVWSGVPLWLLVAMVDDNPDVGADHFNFNDTLATQGYSVKVTAGDGYNTTLASADIARNNGYIVANKLNGTDLPFQTPGGKLSWPLHLKGSAVFGGQQVGNITSIELTGMPQPSQGWTLTLEGDVVDVITQDYFEQAIVCHHNITYTDSSARTWTGVPLWDLVGAVDDIETTSHWTFNDTRANATGYTIRVIAGDGFNSTFTSLNASHNNGFIVANTLNGTPLTGSDGHLKLVGPATTSGSQRVGNITTIRLEGLPSYPAGAYSLTLKGKISDVITQPELEEWIAANTETYTDGSGNEYSGIPLWRLLAWVDDRIPSGANAFNDDAAAAGYKVIVKAGDGYSKEFLSGPLARSNDYIVANTLNGSALPTDGDHSPWPLRLVGTGAAGSASVGNIVEIELTDFATVQTAAPLHIIKYGSDGVTIINETNVTYQWMESNLPVIGDGSTVYKFEAITGNTSNIWDPEETYPGGFKIENAVKGSRLNDLCDIVGGMGTGTEIKLIASDGYETTLPYSSVYTNPAVQARQGDAILAWWGDGEYVPYYADGMRLFFMPDDHIYGQWDMNQTLPATYHHFYYQDGIFYPSCAGLSAKYITTIKIYSEPAADWTLELDGREIGGVNSTVSKTYFEQALACQFGSNHSVTYTDSSGREWGGMPLWFLCGFVDDADQHSSNAYNEAKALAGYNITITGSDGYNYTFNSQDAIRNANYIVANTLNGTVIPDGDSSWPLRLVGQNVSGSKIVKKIASIKLVPLESVPSGENILYFLPASQSAVNGTTTTYEVRVSSLPAGLAGYDLQLTLDNPSVAEIVGIQYPGWASLNNTTPLAPGDSLRLSGVDVGSQVEPGATTTLLATITLRADSPGTSGITISAVNMDADGGGIITPVVTSGEINVYVPMVADFEANVTSGKASMARPLFVAFTDLSTGVPPGSSWSWDFDNNGTVDSILQNPVASFTKPGNYTVKLTVQNIYSSDTEIKVDYIKVTSFVKPFPGQTNEPTDPDGDYLYEDINGNGRLDYDDVVIYYENMQWIRDQLDVGIEPYDYNGNGRIDYDDVVLLYEEVLNSRS
jgi:PKD repeat protein/frataxin-like iron-binding protein CyaY/DMSO/TMAO reductase YedYZ molybdopterin-dependent catalytic subunit